MELPKIVRAAMRRNRKGRKVMPEPVPNVKELQLRPDPLAR